MKQKIKLIALVIFCINLLCTTCYAMDSKIQELSGSLGLESVLNTLKEYAKEIDLVDMSDDLLSGDGVDYGVIYNFVSKHITLEIKEGIKTALAITIVLVLLGIIKNLELEKDGTIDKVTSLVGFLIIVTMLIKNYSSNVNLFTETITSLTQIVSVISPVMLAILIATGEIVTSGIISPIILFLTGSIGLLVSYIIVPLLTLALVLNIITSCSQTVKLDKLGNICRSSAMWLVSVAFALFLGVLSLETNISTSIDGVTVKTTQAAVSNLVPVVGKFLSDSLEVVMGASELIGKSIGVIGIIVLIIVLIIPLIKFIVISIIYKLLEAFAETIIIDDKIGKIIGAFAKQYVSLVGIMFGIGATFVIAIGIVMSLFGKAVG